MKTTIEINDELFARVKQVAGKEKASFSSLAERGLRLVLQAKENKSGHWKWIPVTSDGSLTREYQNATWNQISDEIYRSHGA